MRRIDIQQRTARSTDPRKFFIEVKPRNVYKVSIHDLRHPHPKPPLYQFIELLWFHEGFNADHRLERVRPDGSMELIINLRDEKRHVFDPITHQPRETYRRSWLSGPHSEFIVIDTAPDVSMIGVHLRPGGASAFFGLPLSELRNSVVELDTLWNCEAQNLRDQLLEAPNPSAKFRILESALLARWRGFAPRHRAVLYALESFTRDPDNITVGKVTADVGLSVGGGSSKSSPSRWE